MTYGCGTCAECASDSQCQSQWGSDAYCYSNIHSYSLCRVKAGGKCGTSGIAYSEICGYNAYCSKSQVCVRYF